MDIGREIKILGDIIQKAEENLNRVLKLLNKVDGSPPTKIELKTLAGAQEIGYFFFDLNNDRAIKLVEGLLEIERDKLVFEIKRQKEKLRHLLQ